MSSSDHLCQQEVQTYDAMLVSDFLCEAVNERHRISCDDLLENTLCNAVTGWARKDSVRNERVYISGTLVFQGLRCGT